MYTYTNSFHDTVYHSHVSPQEIEDWRGELLGGKPPQWIKSLSYRMWKVLCGIKGCTCGDEFGRR